MIDSLVEFFSRAEGHELKKLFEQTLNCVVIHTMQKNQINSEARSIKNTRQFLSKLSQRIPKMFKNFLNYHLRLYEHESYLLRNAASDILFNILRNIREEG